MTTRRSFLGAVAGTTTVAGLAGCLGSGGGESDPPEDSIETDDELLNSVADPSGQVPPLYFSGYQYQMGELGDLDPSEVIPRIGGSVAGLFAGQLEGVELSALDRITGSIYHSASSGGPLQVQPLPSGQAVHATGEFGSEPILDFAESTEALQSIGEASGYERYMAEIEGGFEAWGVRDSRLIVLNRTDVTRRSQEYESKEETATDALAVEFDQVGSDAAPIVNAAPAFAETVRQLDPGPIRAGTGYALVPQGSDIGTEALDTVVNGVVGAGLSATVDGERTLQRSVSYLDAGLASADAVRNAYAASEIEEIPVDSWEFETAGTTVTARATLGQDPTAAMLRTGLPVPGYQSLFTRIDPGALGREPTPLVFFQPEIDDGRLRLTHVRGGSVEDLQVRYVHDGEVQHESWEGPVSDGDTFTSERTVDGGTQSWVTWRPGTVDAAVLVRFETPA